MSKCPQCKGTGKVDVFREQILEIIKLSCLSTAAKADLVATLTDVLEAAEDAGWVE